MATLWTKQALNIARFSFLLVCDQSILMASSDDQDLIPLPKWAMPILVHASEGMPDKEIARELGIAGSTLDYRWRRIRKILGSSDRTQAVCRGLRLAYREQFLRAEAQYARVVKELRRTKALERELRKANERVANQRALEQRVYAEWIQNQYSKYQDPREWALRMHSLRWQTSTGSAFFFRAEHFLPIRFLYFDGVEQFGYRAEDFWTGEKTLIDFMYEGDREFIYSHYVPMSDLGGPIAEFQYRAVTASGEIRWFYARVVFEKDELGVCSYYSGIGFDGTHNVESGLWPDRAWIRYGGVTYENS
jgi:DNA-binding CsgD family transcriptional regulator